MLSLDPKLLTNYVILQRLHSELPDAVLRQVPNCGHLPHLERPSSTVKLILEFVQRETNMVNHYVSHV